MGEAGAKRSKLADVDCSTPCTDRVLMPWANMSGCDGFSGGCVDPSTRSVLAKPVICPNAAVGSAAGFVRGADSEASMVVTACSAPRVMRWARWAISLTRVA